MTAVWRCARGVRGLWGPRSDASLREHGGMVAGCAQYLKAGPTAIPHHSRVQRPPVAARHGAADVQRRSSSSVFGCDLRVGVGLAVERQGSAPSVEKHRLMVTLLRRVALCLALGFAASASPVVAAPGDGPLIVEVGAETIDSGGALAIAPDGFPVLAAAGTLIRCLDALCSERDTTAAPWESPSTLGIDANGNPLVYERARGWLHSCPSTGCLEDGDRISTWVGTNLNSATFDAEDRLVGLRGLNFVRCDSSCRNSGLRDYYLLPNNKKLYPRWTRASIIDPNVPTFGVDGSWCCVEGSDTDAPHKVTGMFAVNRAGSRPVILDTFGHCRAKWPGGPGVTYSSDVQPTYYGESGATVGGLPIVASSMTYIDACSMTSPSSTSYHSGTALRVAGCLDASCDENGSFAITLDDGTDFSPSFTQMVMAPRSGSGPAIAYRRTRWMCGTGDCPVTTAITVALCPTVECSEGVSFLVADEVQNSSTEVTPQIDDAVVGGLASTSDGRTYLAYSVGERSSNGPFTGVLKLAICVDATCGAGDAEEPGGGPASLGGLYVDPWATPRFSSRPPSHPWHIVSDARYDACEASNLPTCFALIDPTLLVVAVG